MLRKHSTPKCCGKAAHQNAVQAQHIKMLCKQSISLQNAAQAQHITSERCVSTAHQIAE